MTSFDDRERAFENKFAHDAELRFKAEMRRNKLLGLWAAELMGMAEDKALAYAKDIIRSDLAEAGDEDVFRKLRADFDAFGVEISDHRIRKAMEEKLLEARRQVMAEAK
ncbi:MAG: DUF1476 domain-containing protein [Alphaproteobacteria bacterium]|nr:MAG: DUF1476 domain-containing protein [Alphaproteobacteria bacterium]